MRSAKPRLPVLLLTALDSRADDYVVKPFSLEGFHARLATSLGPVEQKLNRSLNSLVFIGSMLLVGSVEMSRMVDDLLFLAQLGRNWVSCWCGTVGWACRPTSWPDVPALLALAVVSGLANLHGVDLQVESRPGEGSCLRLRFPGL